MPILNHRQWILSDGNQKPFHHKCRPLAQLQAARGKLPWHSRDFQGAYRAKLSTFRSFRCDVCCSDASCPFAPETGADFRGFYGGCFWSVIDQRN